MKSAAALLPLLAASFLHAQQVAPTESATADPRAAAPAATAAPGPGARIVRLSQVLGQAQMDRVTGRGYENAFANLPIVQRARLRTSEGVAEVEFEDGSSMRLAPGTEVAFPDLQRNAAGATSTTVEVLKGTVYVSLMGEKGNSFSLRSSNTEITPEPGAHLRLATGDPQRSLTVFHGVAQVNDHGTNLTIGKKSTLVFGAEGQTPQLVATKGDRTEIDEWDKQAVEYHGRQSRGSAFGSSGYGISDLNYYGSFADLPGCGNVWRPYFASAAWDPYSNGTWALYSGTGYSWVSPYPWGWAPYHSGEWQSCGSNGWGWRPGGNFTGLQNAPAVLLRSAAGSTSGRPRPPAPGSPALIPVNLRPIPVSGPSNAETFTFRKDSAGLGVPRQTFGKLSGASAGAVRQGFSNTSVNTLAMGGNRVTSGGVPRPMPQAGNSSSNGAVSASSRSTSMGSPHAGLGSTSPSSSTHSMGQSSTHASSQSAPVSSQSATGAGTRR